MWPKCDILWFTSWFIWNALWDDLIFAQIFISNGDSIILWVTREKTTIFLGMYELSDLETISLYKIKIIKTECMYSTGWELLTFWWKVQKIFHWLPVDHFLDWTLHFIFYYFMIAVLIAKREGCVCDPKSVWFCLYGWGHCALQWTAKATYLTNCSPCFGGVTLFKKKSYNIPAEYSACGDF